MPLMPRPTRSSSTEAGYTRRTRDLVARCRKVFRLGPQEPLDYRQFVGWLIVQRPNWSRPTWRQYKAAVVFYLERETLLRHDPVAQEALETLLPVEAEGCVPVTRRTSGAKLKRFPLRDYRALDKQLADHPTPWSKDLQQWLAAGLLTGLRPKEWGQTVYTQRQGEDALVINNAKATNDRAHGPTRTLLLGGLTDDERTLIRAQVQRATEWAQAQQFERFYHACAATLGRATRRLWPHRQQHVTLYSARHQFTADAKASGLTREEIAAMMGHAVDVTASKHYGKKTAGLDMIRVRPDPQEVARIRSVFTHRFATPHPEVQPKMHPTPRPSEDGAS